MRLHEMLEAAARAMPDGPAVFAEGHTVTFAELVRRVRVTRDTVARWTPPGARVAIVGDNALPWIDAYYGVPAAGRVLVLLNHRLAPIELATMMARAGVELVIAAAELVDPLSAACIAHDRARSSPRFVTFAEWEDTIGADTGDPESPTTASVPPSPPLHDAHRDHGVDGALDVAWIIFSSGTTAEPKGVLLTHASVLAAIDATEASRPIADDDVYVFPYPLCHIAGYNVVRHHARRRPAALLPRFTPERFVAAVSEYGGTSTSVAATMLVALLDHLAAVPEAMDGLRSLRNVSYGAAPMPAPLLRRAHVVLGVDFSQGYGMTELSGNAVFLDGAAHRRALAGDDRLLHATGWPAPGVELRIVDDADCDLEPGTVGEILVRAPQVMVGYLDAPVATAAALTGGWLHTGDVGRLDVDGLLSIVDRKKDLIVTGGENVSSLEVEAVLRTAPGVRDAAVVGVFDPTWGENVCAVVVLMPEFEPDADALVNYVRTRLAGFKTPRHVIFLDAVPESSTGKVLKAELRALIAAHPDWLGDRR